MGRDHRRFALVQGVDDQRLFGEAGAGSEQGFESSVGLESVESAEGGDDALAGAAVAPVIFDDLQVAAVAGGFGAEEHGGALANQAP